METVKLQKSVVLRPYRFRLVLLKYERSPDQEPPPLKRSRWLELLSLFSTRASHVLDREVGFWLPPERRELWLGKYSERKETIR
jgi:hypothetical protein